MGIKDLEKSNKDVSHLLTAFSTVDREKKQLEAKIVELQVALARSDSADSQPGADRFVQKLKDDYDNSQREISFLNSVIVDMQKKVDDLKVSLEVSQASLLGQNITDRHFNGQKVQTYTAPRLFCDICDMFDLHDTDDCPKQASSEMDSPPMFLDTSLVAYNQHSHHGGARGVQRPFCDNCEMFGHSSEECTEEATY